MHCLELLHFVFFQISDIDGMLEYTSVLLKFLSHLLKYSILATTTLSHGNTFELFVKLLKKLTTVILDKVKKTGHCSVQSIIIKLQELFTWAMKDGDLNCTVGNVCRSVTPSRLIDMLMDICKEKVGSFLNPFSAKGN